MFGIERILRDDRCLLLAYDQGFEHGPTDFDDDSVDPQAVCQITKDAGVFTGIVFQQGIAEKYYTADLPPLVLKLNGKTSFHKGEEPVSLQLCSVDQALELGAKAVGYTIYVGSEHEEQMMAEFAQIVDQAHDKALPVVAWMYPRGKHVEGRETTKDVVAYAARLALELGADMAKVPYTGDPDSFNWVVKSAGKTKIVVQGGSKKPEAELFAEVRGFMQAGAVGMAVGRNVWQSDDPVAVARKIAETIWS